jgi:hypothetical protein
MAATSGPNHPGRRNPVDKVRRLQRRLWVAAKRSPRRRFHALYDHVWRSDFLQAAWKRVAGRSNGLRWAWGLVALAMAISLAELTISPARPRFETTPVPAVYAKLDSVRPGIVAEYPLITSNDHIIWQTVYRRPLLNNADFGTPADAARRTVLNPSVPGAAETLALLGVTAIITHSDALDYQDFQPDVPAGC